MLSVLQAHSVPNQAEPTEEQMQQVFEVANTKIQENTPCYAIKIARSASEALYGNAPYDKFRVSCLLNGVCHYYLELN